MGVFITKWASMDNYQPAFKQGELIAKYLQDKLTDNEKDELELWLQSDLHNLELFEKLTDPANINVQLDVYSETNKADAWQNIVKKTGFKATPKKQLARRLLPYAAATFLLLTAAITLNRVLHKKEDRKPLASRPADLMPGGNKAILMLANGSKIVLDNAKHGKIAEQQNVSISKTQSGQIVYSNNGNAPATDQIASAAIVFNSIITPRGGQYEVVLPDGTKVWLNAASSLKYPTVFSGADRRVELTGEAYFEVAKNAGKPFFVKSATQTVEVLGTHFNVNSYYDEKAVRTTLLEGSVKVNSSAGKLLAKLTPGEQAVNSAVAINVIHDADVDEAVAWKNGKFMFHDADLQTIMRQLSRWYDVDVEYQGQVPVKHYLGRISRNVPVSQVFLILKTSGLNFTINGRKIIVKS